MRDNGEFAGLQLKAKICGYAGQFPPCHPDELLKEVKLFSWLPSPNYSRLGPPGNH